MTAIVIGVASVCAVLALVLGWRFPFGQASDGYSYIDLADALADGRIGDAINGYWSVLLPLLLSPFRWAGASGIVAYSLVSAGATFNIVWFSCRIGAHLGAARWPLLVVVSAIGLRTALMAIEVWTPDVLFAAMALAVTYAAMRMDATDNGWRWLRLGLLCGALYYAKPVGLLSGAATAVVVWLIVVAPERRERWRFALGRLAMLLLGYGLMVVPWIVVLSIKYGHITTGSSGAHNLAISAWQGPLPWPFAMWPRPFAGATSYDSDPAVIDFDLPYPVASRDGVSLILGNIGHNLGRFVREEPLWLLLLAVTVVGLVTVILRRRVWPAAHLIAVAFAAIQAFIYLPVLVEHRYLFFSLVLMAVAPLGVVHLAVHSARLRAIGSWIVAIAAVIMLASWSMLYGLRLDDPLAYIRARDESGENLVMMAQSIELAPEACSHVAVVWGNYGLRRDETFEIAHQFDWYYAGAIPHDVPESEVTVRLNALNIDCIIVWDDSAVPGSVQAGMVYLAEDGMYGAAKIYAYDP